MKGIARSAYPMLGLALAAGILAAVAFAGSPMAVSAGNATTWGIPLVNAADYTAGDGNGFESNADFAYYDDSYYASNIDGSGDAHVYGYYSLQVPDGATINGIEARLDWKSDSSTYNPYMQVQLSWNGGSTWTTAKSSGYGSSSWRTDNLGGSSDTWGHSWSVSDLSNSNFRVRVKSTCVNTLLCGARDYYLDWVPVKVYYTPGNLLVNTTFEGGNTDDWLKDNDGSLSADNTTRHGGTWSMRLTPDSGLNVSASQAVDTGEVVGRSVTFSGWYRSSNDASDNRGVYFGIWKLTTSGWVEQCSQVGADSNGTWTSITKTCTMASDIYGAAVVISSTGTTGTVNVDDLSLTASGAGASFSITKLDVTLTAIPTEAAIVMVSNRWAADEILEGTPTPTCYPKEVYVMDGDGSDSVRISHDYREYLHPAVSPDRSMVVAARYANCVMSAECGEGTNPQSLWVMDLANGKEWQLLPSWYWSGMGGVVWSHNGDWVFFGMNTGRYEGVYRIRPDGTGLAKISPDNNWASDVGISKDGNELAYHHQVRNGDGSYVEVGEVWVMDNDGTDNARVSTGATSTPTPGTSGCWPAGDYDPEFSSNDSQIVFASHPYDPVNDPDGINWGISRIDADGTDRIQLKAGSSSNMIGIPSVHPDTDLVLVTEWEWGGDPLALIYQGCATMSLDGSGYTRLEDFENKYMGGVYCRWIKSFPD